MPTSSHIRHQSNFRVKSVYPLKGQYEVTDIIYKCTVASPDKPNKVYLGTAQGDFKRVFYYHSKSFNNLIYVGMFVITSLFA